MKLITTTLAALALTASTAFAGGLSDPIVQPPVNMGAPDINAGLPKQVHCANPRTDDGMYVPGVYVEGIGAFVEERFADRFSRDIGVIPAIYSAKVDREVVAAFNSMGLHNIELVTNRSTEERTESVTTVKDRGVASGGVPNGDNLTSMGVAASDGATILRVRSTIPQDVEIRKAGGGTITVSVGAGDTLVSVDGSGTYIADFTGTGKSKTKATGNQPFNDVSVEDVTVRTTTSGKWCR